MPIYLVCGYRGTGKDTLYKQMIGLMDFNWSIYRSPTYRSSTTSAIFEKSPLKRIAFADALKQEVVKTLNLPSNYDVDDNKNTVIQGKTFRQHCIDIGADARQKDINHWCKLAFNGTNDDPIMVTDWRFPNEKKYCDTLGDIITIRVYRSTVPIPPENEISEHSLHDVQTDFLLVADDEKNTVFQRFPQYTGYLKMVEW